MSSNIEVKVKASNFLRQMSIAEGISDVTPEVLHQEDTFFNVPQGRLKLRVLGTEVGELIFYDRPDRGGVKESNYIISKIPDPASLKVALASALGIAGSVRKKRYLFRSGQTRIHFDEVEGLGEFIELEYVIKEGQDRGKAEEFVKGLMRKLGVLEKDSISNAYVDLIKPHAV